MRYRHHQRWESPEYQKSHSRHSGHRTRREGSDEDVGGAGSRHYYSSSNDRSRSATPGAGETPSSSSEREGSGAESRHRSRWVKSSSQKVEKRVSDHVMGGARGCM